jgi:hypothetical protein
MPFPEHVQNIISQVVGINLPSYMWMSFTIILLPLTKRIGDEKQTGVKVNQRNWGCLNQEPLNSFQGHLHKHACQAYMYLSICVLRVRGVEF